MKDNRFIDLVNLYVDRQITAAETAELEAEIQNNPRRRAIYKQYCQMHRATALVYESFRANAPEQQAAAGQGSIARFENRRRAKGTSWMYYAGGLAAACLALVFVQLNSAKTPDAGFAANKETLPAVHVAAVPVVTKPAILMPAAEPKPGLVSLRNNVAVEQDYAAMLTALRQDDQRTFANSQGRASSLFDDEVFDSQQVLPAGNQRVFRSKQSAQQQQAEFTAFQFQR